VLCDDDRTTRWIAVAAGADILLFDPLRFDEEPRRFALGRRAGALRSLRQARDATGRSVLLAGCARGALVVDCRDESTLSTHFTSVEPDRRLRGGYNSLCLTADGLLGSHSELGLTLWELADGSLGQPVLVQDCLGARAVRHAMSFESTLWLSIDNRVLALPLAQCRRPHPQVQEYAGCRSTVTALLCTPDHVLAGTQDGDILRWAPQVPGRPTVLRAGLNRPVESLATQITKGVHRLFFTDTSSAVTAWTWGDDSGWRFEAGGQTLLRVRVGPDLLVATNERRDRLLCWPVHDPGAAPIIVPVARLAGHSVQDVCLIPGPVGPPESPRPPVAPLD
jgi:hypothetical protein